ncbi:endonuclease/exonuclease/phosphatase family protein [Paracoccus homiensis]|uniref:Metal-dependent hydrolase, endonuclease/exonuclease/phosphatase family n=1 Tax=Paracoccus homiensis TaxID=364199 RepID=A0A1I0GT54_9RHOB|nr:endonuclease/exonuclease/phosphatase family protein [Paracoccus homiensis]SET74521.1 Metal-dependent hydrolase, endonuclease/exonuclease/phosphatase family [Paracoccus homiensis]
MTVLKLASYNLHKCRGLTGPHAPERNLSVIHALQPDLIALQEVDFRFGARPEALPRGLIAEMTGLVPLDIVGRTGTNSLGWHGQTILLRPDIAATARLRRLPLPGIEPRGALALRLEGLTVIAMHLGLARSSRRAQLTRITAQAARIAEDHIVMMGDFNEWRDDRGLESLAGFQVIAPGPSYPAPMPQLRLDRMAMSRDIQVIRHGVFSGADARNASDHLPIWAQIRLP